MEELLADLKARELEEKQPILEELQKLYQELIYSPYSGQWKNKNFH